MVRVEPHEARLRAVEPAELAVRVSERQTAQARVRWRNTLTGLAIAAVVVAASATVSLRNAQAPTSWAVTPTPASTGIVITGWEPLHCADGWPSRSIGKRGACSHHGGVTGGPIFHATVTPAVAGVLKPPRTDWSLVIERAFWCLLIGGVAGLFLWVRVAR